MKDQRIGERRTQGEQSVLTGCLDRRGKSRRLYDYINWRESIAFLGIDYSAQCNWIESKSFREAVDRRLVKDRRNFFFVGKTGARRRNRRYRQVKGYLPDKAKPTSKGSK